MRELRSSQHHLPLYWPLKPPRSLLVPASAFKSTRRTVGTAAHQTQRQVCLVHDLSQALTPYEKARALQHELVQHLLSAASSLTAPNSRPRLCGHLMLVQHPPVYTLGAGSSLEHVHFDPLQPPHPLYYTERGGEVTYHGPGQLVMYPILNLKSFQTDLHWYLRALEEVIIRALHVVSGLTAERIEAMTGVWVGNKKIAAIGVRAKRWVTYHGLALNVQMDLQPFNAITPCGLVGRQATSVELACKHNNMIPRSMLLLEYAAALLDCFAEVFDVDLLPRVSQQGLEDQFLPTT